MSEEILQAPRLPEPVVHRPSPRHQSQPSLDLAAAGVKLLRLAKPTTPNASNSPQPKSPSAKSAEPNSDKSSPATEQQKDSPTEAPKNPKHLKHVSADDVTESALRRSRSTKPRQSAGRRGHARGFSEISATQLAVMQEANRARKMEDAAMASLSSNVIPPKQDGVNARPNSLLGSIANRILKPGNTAAASTAPAPISSISEKYGSYSGGVIGRGSTCVIRLLQRNKEGEAKFFAVKEYLGKRRNETEKEYYKRLTSEFIIGSSLHHRHIIETYELIEDDNGNWKQVMEYCPGGDLHNKVMEESLSERKINSFFKQLIEGIAFMHAHGVAHRDIKPENLLFGAKGFLKITDFGSADVFRQGWETKAQLSFGQVGSVPYCAPEMLRGVEYDARLVDMWSCGMVYLFMVHGTLGWRSATVDDPEYRTFLEKRCGNYMIIDRLSPPSLVELLNGIIEPSPAKRLTAETVQSNSFFRTIVKVPIRTREQ